MGKRGSRCWTVARIIAKHQAAMRRVAVRPPFRFGLSLRMIGVVEETRS
jgi:hypothetical protein